MMLVARRALAPVLERSRRARGGACAELASEHRETVMVGRTLLQQAAPITFGLKAALWLDALASASRRLVSGARARRSRSSSAAPSGRLRCSATAASRSPQKWRRQLELADPRTPWHTIRWRPARLACTLGAALGVMAKVARDITLLAQTEVGEATESGGQGRGGSSTMPHKRNPVGAVAVLACAQRAPGLVAAVLGAMVQEHERAAGAWQGEWGPLLELLGLAASAAASLREALELLEVDPVRMRENIDELVMAESVVTALGGGAAAQKMVQESASAHGTSAGRCASCWPSSSEVMDRLGQDGLERALDPAQYLGVAGRLIDRALEAFRDAGEWTEDEP